MLFPSDPKESRNLVVTKKAEPKTKTQCVYVSRVRNTSPGFSVYTGLVDALRITTGGGR